MTLPRQRRETYQIWFLETTMMFQGVEFYFGLFSWGQVSTISLQNIPKYRSCRSFAGLMAFVFCVEPATQHSHQTPQVQHHDHHIQRRKCPSAHLLKLSPLWASCPRCSSSGLQGRHVSANRRHGVLRCTLICRAPRGNWHFYFWNWASWG